MAQDNPPAQVGSNAGLGVSHEPLPSLDAPNGMTLAELKELVKDWPAKDI